MSRVTDLALRNLKGRTSEKVGGRGDGTLLFERRDWGKIEAYYRYRMQGKDYRIKLGEYQQKGGAGLALKECREEANKLARIKQEHPNLKEWLELNKAAQLKQQEQAFREFEAEKRKGSLADLVDAYTGHLERQGKQSAKTAKYQLYHYVLEPFPEMAERKANEITIDDVVLVIRTMIKAGITTTCNRVRSYLMASFNYARQADNDPRQVLEHGKRFGVTINPVEGVPPQRDFEKARERVLTDDELRGLWHNLGQTPCVGPLMEYFIQLVIALGGQRPKQLLACGWDDYDLVRRHVTITDTKGRRAEPRKHVVPLTDRAIEILKKVQPFTQGYEWPFSVNGKAPYTDHALSVAVSRYLKHQTKQSEEQGNKAPEKFLLKDVRRTCKRLMIDAGVNRDARNLIQSHNLVGVDFRHYDHTDHLPEKREALRRYDAHLSKVLSGEEYKVVDITTAKSS